MTEQNRHRIHSHMTKTSFLHVEDSLGIGKLRLFAGHYQRGNGSNQMTAHWLDVANARVILSDMAKGLALDYGEFKGSPGDPPVSRVLKIKSGKDGKVWIRLEAGPGQVIGEGAVKPAGAPETVINVPFTTFEARKLALAVLSYCQAWETAHMLQQRIPTAPLANRVCPDCHTRPCVCDDGTAQFFLDDYQPSGFEQDPDQVADQAPAGGAEG